METEYKNCCDSETASRYFDEHREFPLHLTKDIERMIKEIKQQKHTEDYKNQRIELIKYLYCKLAKSDILRAYSRDMVRVRKDKLTDDEVNEAIRIITEAKDLLNKTRENDKYHIKSTHWRENKKILSNYINYLSKVYQIPTAIMSDGYIEQKQKPLWKLW